MPLTLRADEAQDRTGGPGGPLGAERRPQAVLAAAAAAGPGRGLPWPAALYNSTSEWGSRLRNPNKEQQPLEPLGKVRG